MPTDPPPSPPHSPPPHPPHSTASFSPTLSARIAPRSGASAARAAGEPGSDGVFCVVLGSDAAARSAGSAPGVDATPAASSLDAIGALGRHAAAGLEPTRRAVILGPRAAAAGAEADRLIAALRRVDADARVIGIDDGSGPLAESLNATVTSDAFDDPAALARTLRGEPPAPPRERPPGTAPEPVAEPGPDPETEHDDAADRGASSAPEPMGDPPGVESLLLALLRGGDAVEAALRSAGCAARFVATEDPPAAGPGERVEPVRWRGVRLGWAVAASERDAARAARLAGLAGAFDRQLAELRRSALTDPLTGAWNRRYFDRMLARLIDKARDDRRELTVLLFDLDDFKRWNDRYGHPAGDEILTETVRLLRSEVRPGDKVCRIGGDEFAVIFADPEGPREAGSEPPRTIFDVADRFQRSIRGARFPKLADEAPGPLSISGGLATFPWDGADAASLVRHADELAMRSKREGKNAICLGPGAQRSCGGPPGADRAGE